MQKSIRTLSMLSRSASMPKKYSTSPSESILNGFMGSVGNTALIKLERFSKETGCNILVKCEYMNPGGNLFFLFYLLKSSRYIFILEI